MDKIIQSIQDIKEQIAILDIEIAKDISLNKENKEQTKRKYQLQERLKKEEAIYSTYLEESIANLEMISDDTFIEENNPKNPNCTICKNCEFAYSKTEDGMCVVCRKPFSNSL